MQLFRLIIFLQPEVLVDTLLDYTDGMYVRYVQAEISTHLEWYLYDHVCAYINACLRVFACIHGCGLLQPRMILAYRYTVRILVIQMVSL